MRLFILSIVIGAAALLAFWRVEHRPAEKLRLEILPTRLAADGYASAELRTNVPASFAIVEGQHAARIEGSRVVAGVMGGDVIVEARARGHAPARATLATVAQAPEDFLRLDDGADRAAFVRWFTFLAEAQAFAGELPPEINDCAALVRFAFREALREHDGRWAGELKLAAVPAIPGVRKYAYPFTPLGAKLFRAGEGFAEFADARTLVRDNAWFVTRDIHQAAPGDLVFFRQLDRAEPYHIMIFLGRSQLEPGSAEYVVYHTGPFDGGPGEIRRPAVEELLRHPSPAWRPEIGNPNFKGIYRWNILRRSY
jgi:uncharacterized protein